MTEEGGRKRPTLEDLLVWALLACIAVMAVSLGVAGAVWAVGVLREALP